MYRALAIANKSMPPDFRPDFMLTAPPVDIPYHPSWKKVVSLDPWGAEVVRVRVPRACAPG